MNVLHLSGRLATDLQSRNLADGKTMVKFRFAFSKYTGKNSKTEFMDAVIFGKSAELAVQFLKKGSPVILHGAFYIDEWEKDGVKRQTPTIEVDRWEFFGSRPEDDQAEGASSDAPAKQEKPAARKTADIPSKTAPKSKAKEPEEETEIPF